MLREKKAMKDYLEMRQRYNQNHREAIDYVKKTYYSEACGSFGETYEE